MHNLQGGALHVPNTIKACTQRSLACLLQGVTADGGLFLNFQQDGKKTSASKPEPASLRKLRISESLKHGLKDRKAAKQLQDLAQQGKTGSLIVQPLSSRPEVPPLTLVLMCTGTRGDVQPFIVRPCSASLQ